MATSLFGFPAPDTIQEQLLSGPNRQDISLASLPRGRVGVATASEGGRLLGNGLVNALGGENKQVASAQALQNVMQKVNDSGLNIQDHPVAYMKLAAHMLASHGMIAEAGQVMDHLQQWELNQSKMFENYGIGMGQSKGKNSHIPTVSDKILEITNNEAKWLKANKGKTWKDWAQKFPADFTQLQQLRHQSGMDMTMNNAIAGISTDGTADTVTVDGNEIPVSDIKFGTYQGHQLSMADVTETAKARGWTISQTLKQFKANHLVTY